MQAQLRELQKKDYSQAMQYAIEGMHFNWYMENRLLLKLYARYFWYLELTRATHVLATYCGDALAGVLLAEIKGGQPCCRSWGMRLYVRVFDVLQRLFAPGGAGVYEAANRALFEAYRRTHTPDGEVLFLAAAPAARGTGVGSLLLAELARRAPGKEVYLYTDDACTYQFYEKRGFHREGERCITVEFGGRKTPLRCFLYSRVLG